MDKIHETFTKGQLAPDGKKKYQDAMNWLSRPSMIRRLQFAAIAQAMLLVQACWAEEIKVYRIPKETAPKSQPALPSGHPEIPHAHGTTASPKITFTKPEGWTESGPGDMRVLGFNIAGPDGTRAQVAVTPLADMAGKEPFIVNMWRQQVGLGELSPEDAAKELMPVDVGGTPGKLFEIAGKSPEGTAIRIATVMASRGGTSWFYKLQGDDSLVVAQKPQFIAFLKTVKIQESSPTGDLPDGHPPIGSTTSPAVKPAGPVATREGAPTWNVPAGWVEMSGGQFLFAKFNIAGEDGSQAAVNVSTSAGDGGGLSANVNRWLGQIGKPPWTEAELKKNAKDTEAAGGRATFVEMSGTDARTGQPAMIIGATTIQNGQAWFYKLMGEPKLVAAQREAFTRFVKEVKY